MLKEILNNSSISELLQQGKEIDCTREEFFSELDEIITKASAEGYKVEGPILSYDKGLNKLTYDVKKGDKKVGEISLYYGNFYRKYVQYVKFSRL
ncbi:hypothetical protein Ahos_0472 [Acidianus hospitalis W1]|jgi:hypothetical protein|uniref:Uncharacterized protein n=1 Tax=Acidianus hospitalis (strain W1) TaxID=933801 RepID=F4B672_ACIHW|nr:hypothetical protein [Acidianus hospitalis]AEE93360.1 hypothetical protein Ahos_0472 [Acidianus hospitalis W1]